MNRKNKTRTNLNLNLRWTPLISAISALSAASMASGVMAMPETDTSTTSTNQEVASLPIALDAIEDTSISATLNQITSISEPETPTQESQPWLSLEQIATESDTESTTPEVEVNESTLENDGRLELSDGFEDIDDFLGEEEEVDDGMGQVTNVNQLRDVSPGDWAYEALRNLVETYGCIAGYPDGTYRGNRAMTRYEFAAGLNACLQQIERLIAASTADFVTKGDLETLQRLREEFAAELSTVASRVDSLEERVGFLEDNQFSTTTKFRGIVTIAAADAFSGEGDDQAVLHNDVILALTSSFTGKDRLEMTMIATNTDVREYDTPNGDLNIADSFLESTREGALLWEFEDTNNNSFRLRSLDYTFPVYEDGDTKVVLTFFTSRGFGAGRTEVAREGSAWQGPGRPISAFALRNPIFRLNGRAGFISRFQFSKRWRLGASYQANPGNDPVTANSQGLFNGNYTAFVQLVGEPIDQFAFALTYANHYSTPGNFKFSRRRGNGGPNSPGNPNGFVGTGLANAFDNAGVFFGDDRPVISNIYGLQAFYQLTPTINFGGFVSKISARVIGRGDADIWTWAAMLTLTDLFQEGNIGGLVVGMEPTLTGLRVGDDFVGGFENDTSLHIEAYYRYKVNRFLSITPGVIWITAPNQDADNEDIVVGTVAMQFVF